MTTRRMFMMSGGSLVPLLVLALLVGNQWVVDGINKSGFKFDEGLGPLVSHLFFVAWRFTPPRGLDWRFVVSDDFSTLLLFALVAVLVLAGARTVDPERGVLGALITGWWATVVAGGIAGGVAGLLLKWSVKYSDGSVSRNFFESLQAGAASGLLYGWLAGVGALVGFLLSRPRGQAAPQFGQYAPQQQPYNPQQPYAPQQAAPMQQPYAQQPFAPQPYAPQQGQQGMQQPMQQGMQQGMPMASDQAGLPPQHPAAVPYVPPARPSQSPAWGGVPVPPQQPDAPASEAAPQASEAAVEPPAEQAAPEPEEARAQDGEPAQHEPQDAVPDDAPADEASSKDAGHDDGGDEEDDLRLPDRTRADRKPDLPRDAGPMPPPM
ncbi:hypothetical protein [Actinomadura opuntiae]|uniref:hypothetical protein n=1 Tax=Actinomadura sp. OS1-43 TaxID=604315 RepID=UPI00255AF84C|nr:hypothetical protein [Actinomadura sp. OS1-43]MDL4819392.1 hypothetical protein [Actinomadura sp. OS1-43]